MDRRRDLSGRGGRPGTGWWRRRYGSRSRRVGRLLVRPAGGRIRDLLFHHRANDGQGTLPGAAHHRHAVRHVRGPGRCLGPAGRPGCRGPRLLLRQPPRRLVAGRRRPIHLHPAGPVSGRRLPQCGPGGRLYRLCHHRRQPGRRNGGAGQALLLRGLGPAGHGTAVGGRLCQLPAARATRPVGRRGGGPHRGGVRGDGDRSKMAPGNPGNRRRRGRNHRCRTGKIAGNRMYGSTMMPTRTVPCRRLDWNTVIRHDTTKHNTTQQNATRQNTTRHDTTQ
mmetsp:Transcript_19552/g.41149  ORF Transcript_19552/g.41149 Transcript_19552/m.41149 type:complete len:278 (+) Transcript_19552:950-1783(+)